MVEDKKIAMKLLAQSILMIVIASNALAEGHEFCGEITEVQSYELRAADVTLSFPRILEIRANDRVVYTDGSMYAQGRSIGWAFPQNGLRIALLDDHILIEIHERDCVDLLFRKLVVLSRSGDFILSQPIWTSHWNDAFYLEGQNLVYWSERFCGRANRESGESYVYLWPGHEGFQKDERPYESVCGPEFRGKLNSGKIRFITLEPDKHGEISTR